MTVVTHSPLEEHLFHFTVIGNMMCSSPAAPLWRQENCHETDNENQTGHAQAQEGENNELQGVGKKKLYNSCCLGTLAGTNREATNDPCQGMFLLQLQGELHTWGCRGSAINNLIFIVPSMLLAMLLETASFPRKSCIKNKAALQEQPTRNHHNSVLLY